MCPSPDLPIVSLIDHYMSHSVCPYHPFSVWNRILFLSPLKNGDVMPNCVGTGRALYSSSGHMLLRASVDSLTFNLFSILLRYRWQLYFPELLLFLGYNLVNQGGEYTLDIRLQCQFRRKVGEVFSIGPAVRDRNPILVNVDYSMSHHDSDGMLGLFDHNAIGHIIGCLERELSRLKIETDLDEPSLRCFVDSVRPNSGAASTSLSF